MQNLPNVPQQFICPITQMIMKDPVANNQGVSFQRYDLEQWIKKTGTDPLSRRKLSIKELTPNLGLRSVIQGYLYKILYLRQNREILKSHQCLEKYIKKRIKQMQAIDKKVPDPHGPAYRLGRQRDLIRIKFQAAQQAKQQQEYQKKREIIVNAQKKALRKEIKQHELQIQIMSKSGPADHKNLDELYKLKIAAINNIKCNISPAVDGQIFKKSFIFFKDSNTCICRDTTFLKRFVPTTWIRSKQYLPINGYNIFSLKAVNVANKRKICIGIIDTDQNDSCATAVYYSVQDKQIYGWGKQEHKTKFEGADDQLINMPNTISVHMNAQQNTISWHFNGRQQAQYKTKIPLKGRKLNALVGIFNKGDSVQFVK